MLLKSDPGQLADTQTKISLGQCFQQHLLPASMFEHWGGLSGSINHFQFDPAKVQKSTKPHVMQEVQTLGAEYSCSSYF